MASFSEGIQVSWKTGKAGKDEALNHYWKQEKWQITLCRRASLFLVLVNGSFNTADRFILPSERQLSDTAEVQPEPSQACKMDSFMTMGSGFQQLFSQKAPS